MCRLPCNLSVTRSPARKYSNSFRKLTTSSALSTNGKVRGLQAQDLSSGKRHAKRKTEGIASLVQCRPRNPDRHQMNLKGSHILQNQLIGECPNNDKLCYSMNVSLSPATNCGPSCLHHAAAWGLIGSGISLSVGLGFKNHNPQTGGPPRRHLKSRASGIVPYHPCLSMGDKYDSLFY